MNAGEATGCTAIAVVVSIAVPVLIAVAMGLPGAQVWAMVKLAAAIAIPLNAAIAVFVVRST